MINLKKHISQEELEKLYLGLNHIQKLSGDLGGKIPQYEHACPSLANLYKTLLKVDHNNESNLHKLLLYKNINHSHSADSLFKDLNIESIDWDTDCTIAPPTKEVKEYLTEHFANGEDLKVETIYTNIQKLLNANKNLKKAEIKTRLETLKNKFASPTNKKKKEEEINQLISFISESASETKSQNKIIQDDFNYDKLRKEFGLKLVQHLELNACPYCNSQYILHIEGADEKVYCQLDHFLPKSEYPYLCLSLYNLIPVCTNCNHTKGTRGASEKDALLNPYDHSLHDYFKFDAPLPLPTEEDPNALKRFLNDRKIQGITAKPQVLADKANEERIKRHLDVFKIEDIYENHLEYVQELHTKAYIYNESFKGELERRINKLNLPFSLSPNEINRLVLGNYTNEEDLNKRPLAKLTKDIAEELGLL